MGTTISSHFIKYINNVKRNKLIFIYTILYFIVTLIAYLVYPYSNYQYHIFEQKSINQETSTYFQNVRPSETIRFIQDGVSYGVDCQTLNLCSRLSNAILLNADYIVKVKTCQVANNSKAQLQGKHNFLCNIYLTKAQFKTNEGNIINYSLSKSDIKKILGNQEFPFGAFFIWYLLILFIISILYNTFKVKSI